jgi:hypothetical protein
MNEKKIYWFSCAYPVFNVGDKTSVCPTIDHATLKEDCDDNIDHQEVYDPLDSFIYYKVCDDIIVGKYSHKDVMRMVKLNEL